jgi:hypothetical protein
MHDPLEDLRMEVDTFLREHLVEVLNSPETIAGDRASIQAILNNPDRTQAFLQRVNSAEFKAHHGKPKPTVRIGGNRPADPDTEQMQALIHELQSFVETEED